MSQPALENGPPSSAGGPRNKVGILLTACIAPGQISFLVRRDPYTRLEDYKRSLRLWLSQHEMTPLVFCENSGYDLTEIREICGQGAVSNRPIEVLSFDGQHFPPHFGKGYGEMGIIEHALAQARTLQDCDLILKVTGRHYVQNSGALIRQLQNLEADIFCDLRFNLTFADSRVFCASVSFLKEYLLPQRKILNDSNDISFEHVLARAVHRAMADGLRWSLLPRAPDIRGINATADVAIPDSWLRRLKRELFRVIKSRVLMR